MKIRQYLAVVAIFGAVWGITYSVAAPLSHHRDAKNLVRDGDHAGAMAQAERLLAAMRDNNWSADGIDKSLLTLPDQGDAEPLGWRDPTQYSFYAWLQPVYQERVAFFTDLYVRKNFRVVSGVEATVSPEGFYIVGWKDGRVTQVPIGDVRMLPVGETRLAVFPGMTEYRTDLPRIDQP